MTISHSLFFLLVFLLFSAFKIVVLSLNNKISSPDLKYKLFVSKFYVFPSLFQGLFLNNHCLSPLLIPSCIFPKFSHVTKTCLIVYSRTRRRWRRKNNANSSSIPFPVIPCENIFLKYGRLSYTTIQVWILEWFLKILFKQCERRRRIKMIRKCMDRPTDRSIDRLIKLNVYVRQ